ncbi:dihydropteroate synthase [Marisediminicola senii]|uniref:dihydropteroate synthase n=1 Tax=Marisediminicola senii TaxID=2711233 RepID=UPI0013EBB94C|nr:dihydropteroate synthase [Marisediminicola senii]
MAEHAAGRAAARPERAAARPVILGILNVTPDSFSDGGVHADVDSAVAAAHRMVVQGADIIDVGGESTRPGAQRVPVEVERQRIEPVVRELAAAGIAVSIDTMNAATAAIAMQHGASIVNDVSGGLADPDMAGVVAAGGARMVAMHWRGPSATMNDRTDYGDVVGDVIADLDRRMQQLVAEGIDESRVILDPGIGFAKNAGQNWRLLAAMDQFTARGTPVLVGVSRKRFLADLLPDGEPPVARDAATAVISAMMASAGAWGVRVHDVAATAAALDAWSAIEGARS